MADKIFENKVGWFSNSCANQVIAKWGKLIIILSTNNVALGFNNKKECKF